MKNISVLTDAQGIQKIAIQEATITWINLETAKPGKTYDEPILVSVRDQSGDLSVGVYYWNREMQEFHFTPDWEPGDERPDNSQFVAYALPPKPFDPNFVNPSLELPESENSEKNERLEPTGAMEIKYQVICADAVHGLDGFKARINRHLQDGWNLHGGLTIGFEYDTFKQKQMIYLQALTRGSASPDVTTPVTISIKESDTVPMSIKDNELRRVGGGIILGDLT